MNAVTDPAALVEPWLTEFVQPGTRSAYQRDVERLLAWCAGEGLDPLQLPRPAVNAYRDALIDDFGLMPASVDRQISSCRSFYRYLVAEGIVDGSVAFDHVRRLQGNSESTTPWLDEEELRRLLLTAHSSGPRDFILTGLLGLNGLRVSEAIAAGVPDLGRSGGHRVLRVRRKGSKLAIVPLATELAAAIDPFLDGRANGPLVVRLHRSGRPMMPLAPITRSSAHRRVKALAERAGVNPAISPHSLRHSYITLALRNGSPLHVVQAAAGHSSPTTTQHYNRELEVLEANPTFGLAASLLRGEAS